MFILRSTIERGQRVPALSVCIKCVGLHVSMLFLCVIDVKKFGEKSVFSCRKRLEY